MNCPLAQQLQDVSNALKSIAGKDTSIQDYTWRYAAEILWQVTNSTTKFFTYAATAQQLAQIPPGQTIPFPPLTRLVDDILRGQITTSIIRPLCFQQPTNKKQRQPRDDPRQKRTRPDAQSTSGNPRPKRKPHTRNLNRKCAAVLETHRAANKHLPRICDVRTANNITDDAALAAALGVTHSDCLKYTLYGYCNSNGCQLNHIATTTADDHIHILTKALNAHVDRT